MKIDFQALALVLILLNSLQTVALAIQLRVMDFLPRLNWWSIGNLCFIIGLALQIFTINTALGRTAADYALILGSVLIYFGARQFLGLPHTWNWRSLKSLGLSSAIALGLIEFYVDSAYIHPIILTAAIAVFSGLTARLLYYYRQYLAVFPVLFLSFLFLVTTITSVSLTTLAVLGLMNARWIRIELLAVATNIQLLTVSTLGTLGLILVVNQQMIALGQQEKETAEQIFNASPDAILITRLSDSLIVKANQSFLTLIDQNKERIIGQSVLDMKLWQNQSDRARMIDCLLARGSCDDLEVTLQRPNQSHFIGLITAKLIKVDGQFHIISTIRDITQRRQFELSLRKSEERFELAFRGSLAAIWEWNLITNDLYFSSRSLEILGYQADEIPEEISSFFNLLYPDDRILVQSALDAHFSSAQYPYDVEYRIRHKSGDYRWFQSTGIAVRDEQGTPYRMVGSTIDITGRKQAEAALRESEQNYRTVVNSGQALIWLVDSDGLAYYFNLAWLNFTGRSLEQESGTGWLEGIHPEDFQHYLNTFQTAFAQRKSFKTECRLRRCDGEYRWILNEGSPHYDSRGAFLGYIGHCLDIHDRKIIEATLYREQEFIRTLLDSLSDGVVACDAQGRLVLFNRVAREWHGLDALSIPLDEWSQYYSLYQPDGSSPLSTESIPLVRAFHQEQVCNAEMMIDAKHQQPRWVLSSGGPFFDDQNRFLGAVIAMRDITAQRQAEQKLNQVLAEAQRFRSALDQLNSYVYMKDLESRYIYANKATLELFGCSLETLIGQDDYVFFPTETVERLQAIDARVFQGEQTKEEVQVLVSEWDKPRFYWEVKTPIYESLNSNKVIGLLGISTDITERKQLEAQLQQQATTDGLTGIFNRRQFIALAQNELSRAHRSQRGIPLSLAIIDIDYFKAINDSYGHTIGDQVLMVWTDICKQNIREVDIFARLGGDEFIILFPETNGEQAFQVMERIRQLIIEQSLHLPNRAISITISVGIAIWTPEIFTLDQLLERADRALYQAKDQGRNRIIVLGDDSNH